MAGAGASGAASSVIPLIAAPPEVTVGDLPLGRHTKKSIPVFNLDQQNEATVAVRVVGSTALRIISKPDRLRPSHEGFDASRQVELEFRPTTSGRLAATIEIVMWWPNGGRQPQTLLVPVVGGAHDPMAPTLDEQDLERAAADREEQAKAKHVAEQEGVDRSIRAEERRDTHFHEGNKRRLGNERDLAGFALTGLYESRQNGIEGARAAIGEFKRIQPRDDRTLLEELAWLALDVASAGIAGGVAKRLEPVLKKILHSSIVIPYPMVDGQISLRDVAEVPAGAGIVGLITDGIKHLVKTGTKAGVKALHAGEDESERPPVSVDAREDFLLAHKELMVTDTMKQAGEVAIRCHDALLPTLKHAPDAAVAAMAAIKTGLEVQQESAKTDQTHQTLVQWVRYVAQNSLGSVQSLNNKTKKPESLTAIERANEKREDNKPLKRQDGLVDVSFTADFHHPEQPVKFKGARLTGVRRGVAEHLLGKPLNTFDLAVRASGSLGGPSVSVTVVRDERGNVTYTDNTTVEWEQATWLARKAGVVTHGRPSDEQRGARKLIEEEIMVKPLEALETDSET